jgi:hypothetical protein
MSLNDISNKVVNDESDDDVPSLSAETFKALQEFYSECEMAEKNQINENWV